jgi:hypothetical protein
MSSEAIGVPGGGAGNRNVDNDIGASTAFVHLGSDHTKDLQLIGPCLFDCWIDSEGGSEVASDAIVEHSELAV